MRILNFWSEIMSRKWHPRDSFSKSNDYLKKKKKHNRKNEITKNQLVTFTVTFTFNTSYNISPTFTNYFETNGLSVLYFRYICRVPIKSLYGTSRYRVYTTHFYWRTILEIFCWVLENFIYSTFYILPLIKPAIVQWVQRYGV